MPSTFVIDGDGDEASMSSYVTVVRCDDPASIVFQGRYVDKIRRVDGAWKLAHRTILTDWIDAGDGRAGAGARPNSARQPTADRTSTRLARSRAGHGTAASPCDRDDLAFRTDRVTGGSTWPRIPRSG